MKFKQNKRWLCFLAPLLAFGSAAEAAQFTTSQIPVPGVPGAPGTFKPATGPYLDPESPFESVAYFRGTKSTSGGVGTYTLQASNKASNVGLSGNNYTLTWWANPSKAYTITDGVYDLNLRGTATGTNAGIPVSGNGCNSPGACSNTVTVFGKGISGDMSWLQTNVPAAYTAFTSLSTNRNLFSATLTAFDIFGESTGTTTDDAIAFRWNNPTGALPAAGLADPFNFQYFGGLTTSNFLGASTSFTDTQIYQHLNVPIPGAVWLFGSAFMFLSRGATAGRRKYSV